MATKTEAPKRSPRERLLAAANELFYAEGVQTVGIDRIIEHAGVAKASLYNTFGSKEALVAPTWNPGTPGRWTGCGVRSTGTPTRGRGCSRCSTPRAPSSPGPTSTAARSPRPAPKPPARPR